MVNMHLFKEYYFHYVTQTASTRSAAERKQSFKRSGIKVDDSVPPPEELLKLHPELRGKSNDCSGLNNRQ